MLHPHLSSRHPITPQPPPSIEMSPTPQLTSSGDQTRVLLIPSAGMGHLIPITRLTAALSARGIPVSLLAVRPTVSASESRLLSSLPSSLLLDFPLPTLDSLFPSSSDPFFLQMESIRRSAHLLPPLLSTSSSSPVSALIVDVAVAPTFIPVAVAASIPCYILFTSSAAMLALCTVFHALPHSATADNIEIADVLKIPASSLPPPLRDPNSIFTSLFVDSGRALTLPSGILVNTFDAFENEMLAALNSGKVVPGLPPVIAVGPLPPLKKQSSSSPVMHWLDEQPQRSVMYVSFGSRTAMSMAQIRELGSGLEMSGCRFLWIVKSAKVDREEASEIDELVGEGYVKRVEGRGLVVRDWVEQEVVLGHRAVAGFLSHCGWNSVTEAAAAGVRVLAWPRGGDQRVNAAVVAGSGLGVWPEKWAWEAEEGVVVAEEIAEKVRELMVDERVGQTASRIAEKAAEAVAEGRSSEKGLALFDNKKGVI